MLDSLNFLTYAFEYIGDYVYMLKSSKKSVECSKKYFSEKDILTFKMLKREASCLITAGNHIESELNSSEDLICDEFLLARKTLQQLYKNMCDKFGSSSIEIVEVLSCLAYAHYLCDEFEQEFNCYFERYKIQCELFGEYSQNTLETLNILNGTLYAESDDYEDGLWLKKKVYETICAVEGNTSVNSLYAMIELAQKYDDCEDDAIATQMYDEALLAILGNIHLNGMIGNLKILGNIFNNKKDYDKALIIHKKLYELFEDNIKEKLKYMGLMAVDYKNLGQRENAMMLCEEIYQNKGCISQQTVEVLDEIRLHYVLEDALGNL